MKERICQFDNCADIDTPYVLSISWRGERQENRRFCSSNHMALWMSKYASHEVAYAPLTNPRRPNLPSVDEPKT